MRHIWTAADDAKLREEYPHNPTAKIVHLFSASASAVSNHAYLLGLKKSDAYLASPQSGRLNKSGNRGGKTRFVKGMIPWNLGKRGYMGANRTSFRKGNYSKRWDAEAYCMGALRVAPDGSLEIKSRPHKWEAMARYVWRTEKGSIPRGHVVRPINGDTHDTQIHNLRLCTRADLMNENTYHKYPKPIALAIQLRGALNRRINSMVNHEQHN